MGVGKRQHEAIVTPRQLEAPGVPSPKGRGNKGWKLSSRIGIDLIEPIEYIERLQERPNAKEWGAGRFTAYEEVARSRPAGAQAGSSRHSPHPTSYFT